MRRFSGTPTRPRLHLRPASLIAMVALVGGIGLQTPHPTAEEPAAVVEMTNTLIFTPDTVRIKAGTTVEWRNTSLLVHTVTADPDLATLAESVQLPEGAKPFNSGNLDVKATFRHTFDVPGTYLYFCIPHEGAKMRGLVIVEPTGRQESRVIRRSR